MAIGLGIALFVILADQISKYWVLNELLHENAVVSYASFFNLVRAWNTGVSFSMFNNYGNFGAVILSAIALGIVALLLYWLYTEKNVYAKVALGMIIGGALGNVADRIRLGAVFDFLDFHIAENHWPAFNVADSFICIGAAVLVLQSLFCIVRKNEVSE